MRVLIVEDERRLAEVLGQIMVERHWQADTVYDGADGVDYAIMGQYDAIVLDVMLPKVDGFEVARRLRAAHVSTPILMLTARDEIPDKISGLNCGADDYMTKPFDTGELIARLNALTRRQGPVVDRVLAVGDVTLELSERYQGCFDRALERLLKTNPFPEFTGRVCPALCEAACTCGLHGKPVTVRQNELGIIEDAFDRGAVRAQLSKVRTGKTVAVVGSGPAGLALAQQLSRRGHAVTVYERAPRPGGLLMYGIPNMKMEKSVVERRVALMEGEGVRFVTGTEVGTDVSVQTLREEYDAVCLCLGAKRARDLNVPGREAKGVSFAVDYLSRATQSLLDGAPNTEAKGLDVLVVGGGDTGNDCVGTALRQGAKSVTQLEMMPCPPEERLETNPWPQWPRVKKTDYGQEEAIAVFGQDPRIFETTVKELKTDKAGRLSSAVTVKVASKSDAKTGRRSLEPVAGTETELSCQLLLIAAGFLGPQEELFRALDLPTPTRNDPYATALPGVFVAGDARRGQSLVVWAIREGMECARVVDGSLMGYTNL